MTTSILVTKLFIPPTRQEIVSRPGLIKRLNDGLNRKLSLISAPAGFGKTTLVSAWLANFRKTEESQIEYRIAWLSLDDGDNDPVRFLAYFIAALNRVEEIEAIVGEGALSMLQSPQPPLIEAVLTSLINDIAAAPDKIILVLDDYHLIEAQPIHDALTFLLEHLPLQMLLVIATREDPQLPLARLRARDQLTEFRATDLRFTSSEAAEFLNQVMGLNLSTENIAALENRTEGWIAGLQLAAISLQGREDVTSLVKAFTGSHRLVLDYLIEEVLDQQPENIQIFLLKTAIVDRLSDSLCNAITEQENSQQILEMLEHTNLFVIPLDTERRWYRYHHLFADLLRQRLNQTLPYQLPVLHGKASEWYEQNAFVVEAIEHALKGESFERAANLIEANLGQNYEQVSQATLRRWMSAFPDEFIATQPQLCILQAWTLFTTGQLDAAMQRLQAAEKSLDPSTNQEFIASFNKGQLPGTNRLRLIGRVAAIRSFIVSFSGDTQETISYARQAIKFLPEDDLQWRSTALIALGDAYASQGQMSAAHQARSDALETGKASGDPYLLIIVNLRIAEILRQQGKLQQVITICERQYKQADKNGISEWTIVGWLFGIWGEVLAEINDLDQALQQAQKGVELTDRGRDLLYSVMSNLCLVRVLFSCGNINGAEDAIQSMENSTSEHDLPSWALEKLSAWHVRIWLVQGKLETASKWMLECGLDPSDELTYQQEMEFIALARILIAQGRLDETTGLLRRLLEAAEAGGRTDKVIEILILQSLVYQGGGDTDQAMSTLEQALTLAEPGGFIRIFLDEGPPMVHLLYEALSRGIAPDYVRQLLGAFPDAEPEQAASLQIQATKSDLIEPLSEREIEVIQLIAEGLTNQEIATRLYLSLNTVKVHSRNIYAKLGVNNRTQAGARAKTLGILSPN